MDISFNNVLKGARQYFQGLPAATSSQGNQIQLPPASTTSSQQQQQNDGSVHSEQHSAVPYWDQQNEGQGTNLSNRDVMNPPVSAQNYRYPIGYQATTQMSSQQYQSQVPSSSTYYEVPQQKASYVNVSQQSGSNPTYSYPPTYANYSQTTSTSSQQEMHYNYNKMYTQPTNRAPNYQNYYQAVPQRSHQLPVVPTDIYHKKQTVQHNMSNVNAQYQKHQTQNSVLQTAPRMQNGTSYSEHYKYYQNPVKYTQSNYTNNTTTTTYSNQYLNQNYVDTRANVQQQRQQVLQPQHPQQQQHHPVQPQKYVMHNTNTAQKLLPIIKQKRESPLDLSVKTVKSSADSTLGDYDERNYRAMQTHYDMMMQQHKTARAPKVDFLPNFNVKDELRQQPKAASYYYPPTTTTNSLPRIDFPSVNKNMVDMQRKRPQERLQTVVPEKMPKVDTWRQSIDKQIEQRFSSYTKSRGEDVNVNKNGNQKIMYNESMSGPYKTQHSNTYQYSPYQTYQTQMRQKAPSQPVLKQQTANKKVISLLRNSLQIKEAQKKLEQEQIMRQTYREIQQPSTDVMAPLQPKPGIVGRRNVSPFTAASLERNSNTPPAYKLHIPKAIESVIFSDSEKEQEASMGNQSTDLDGLAAFLAARIRTKAELKQVGNFEQANNNFAIHSPPKLLKEGTPKKLFSEPVSKQRTEAGGIRSSSETSVFDFPDSDNETEMPVLERQSLVDMRKDRKTIPTQFTGKTEDIENEKPPSPFDLIFSETCESFMEQLKQGNGKKRGRRKKELLPPPTINNIKTEPPEEVIKPTEIKSVDLIENIKTEIVNSIAEIKPIADIEIKPISEIKTEQPKDDSDSDTPLIICKQKIQNTKLVKEEPSQEVSSDSEVEATFKNSNLKDKLFDLKDPLPLGKPGRKPTFGDGSDFQPGWEEELYKYKKSLRMPRMLIQVTRPPNCQRLSTSLPDLDPCPGSPALSVFTDVDFKRKPYKTDSVIDSDSSCSYNFSLTRTNYDSEEGSSSVKSLNMKANSILDKLLEKCGGKKRRKYNKKKDDGPKVIAKSENVLELLPTPSLELSNDSPLKSDSFLLGFRKKTVNNFKNAFINNSNIVGEFTTVVLKSRTRTETRVLKEKATIREVFGEDRPASAPPVTCLDEMNEDSKSKENFYLKSLTNKAIKIEPRGVNEVKKENSIEIVKKRSKLRNIRRKFSSGFDYIRKKKKQIKKEDADSNDVVKVRRRGAPPKASPESVQDIQKEIKLWVLNKGVGETHLHRASRSGFTEIAAYCLEKMACNPSPKDNAGYTPLHEACSKGHLDIARLLLEYGAHVSESAQGGIRPLHEAAENGFVEIVRLLLSYGADPTLATYSGITPLQLAVDDVTVNLLQQHLCELQGKPTDPWLFNGPASCFDPAEVGYNPLADVPEGDSIPEEVDIEMEISEQLLPNLYALPDSQTDRWLLLQDLSNILKIKSKETLLRQLNVPSNSNRSDIVREMKTVDFLEQARCCQFLNANEKLNTRSSKIFLVKYTEKVKELLNIEKVIINVR